MLDPTGGHLSDSPGRGTFVANIFIRMVLQASFLVGGPDLFLSVANPRLEFKELASLVGFHFGPRD